MTSRHTTSKRLFRATFGASLLCALVGVIGVSSNEAPAQDAVSQTPRELEGVDIVQKLGDKLPLDLRFTDEKGNIVTLGDYIDGDRPIILTPVYYNCPQLCTLVLNGLVDGLNQVELQPASDFEIVTFSFAPEETTELADRKKRAYLTQYRVEGAKDGWHFLTGDQYTIEKLCDAVGFYTRRQPNGEIAHSASIVFITPDGNISRYMNDVLFQPRDLRLALVDASEGTISAPMDRFLLFTCFMYDPDANSFVPSAWKIMRFFGGLSAILLGATIITLFRMEAKKRAGSPALGSPALRAGSENHDPEHDYGLGTHS